MLFDTHAHYDDDQFDPDREALLASLPEHGVGLVVNPGCTVASSRTAVELAHRFPHIYAAVGIHPENCGDFRPEHLTEIRALAQEDKVVAIGEIGLDYYWDKDNHPQQQAAFIRQIELANRVNKPILVHSRDAIGDTLALLREHPAARRGIIHCFSSSREMAREFVKLGYTIGLGGPVTFKNAKTPKEVAADVDLAHLQIETDCPYLTPVPYRGKRNEPMYLPLTAKTILELRGMEEETLKQSLWDNYQALFHPQDEL